MKFNSLNLKLNVNQKSLAFTRQKEDKMFKQRKASVSASNDTTQYVNITFYQAYLPTIIKALKDAIEEHGDFSPKDKRKAKGDGTHIQMMLPKEIVDVIAAKVLPTGAVLKVEVA